MSSLDGLAADMRARADEMGIVYTYVEVLRILDALKERDDALAAERARAEAAEREVAALKEGLRFVAECFEAAYIEGLAERLAEGGEEASRRFDDNRDASLWGLLERRLLPAGERAAALFSPGNETGAKP